MSSRANLSGPMAFAGMTGASLLLTILLFRPALTYLVGRWGNEDLNYGYFIVPIVLYLLWEKRNALLTTPSRPSWSGLYPFVAGIALYWLGELGGGVHHALPCALADLLGEPRFPPRRDVGVEPLLPRRGNSRRACIRKDGERRLTYYWFPQRGRVLTNMFQMKAYAFWDALTRQRSDGALVRLITPVYGTEQSEDAEARLQRFAAEFVPVLTGFLPGKERR